MKITYVGWAGLDCTGVSVITESKDDAIQFAGAGGTVVRVVTDGERVVCCAVFRGRAEAVWA